MSSNTSINKQQIGKKVPSLSCAAMNKQQMGKEVSTYLEATLENLRKKSKFPRPSMAIPEPDPFESSSDEDISNKPSTSSAPEVTIKRYKKSKSEPGVCDFHKYRQKKDGTWVFHPDRVEWAMLMDSPEYYDLKAKRFNTSFLKNKPRQHEIEMFTPEELETPIIPLPEIDGEFIHVPGEKYKNVFKNIPGLESVELTDEIKEMKKRAKLERKLNRAKGKKTPRFGKVTYEDGRLPYEPLPPNYSSFTAADWADLFPSSNNQSINAPTVSCQDMVLEDYGNKGCSQVVNGSVDKKGNDISVPHSNTSSKKMLVGVRKTKNNSQANGTRSQRSKRAVQSLDNEVAKEVSGHESDLSVVAESQLKKTTAKVSKSPKKHSRLTKHGKCHQSAGSDPNVLHKSELKSLSLDGLQITSGIALGSNRYGDKKYHLLPNECVINNRILRVSLHKLEEENLH